MKGVLIILYANLKKRRIQSFMTGIILLVSAVLFTTSISQIISIKKPFEQMYSDLNASQMLLLNDGNIARTSRITDWWSKQTGVTVQTFPYHFSIDSVIYKKRAITDGNLFFAELPGTTLIQDKLKIIKGDPANAPKSGEIWVCISFADKYHMTIGDRLTISTKEGNKEMTVSAIVADSQFGSPSMGAIRIWLAPGEIQKLFSNRNNGDFIGIHFNDYSMKENLWKAFEQNLGKPYSAHLYSYELISQAYLGTYEIEGALLLAFAVILMIITICIIVLTLTTTVTDDMKTIGIMKAQGFSPFQTTAVYTIQYAILTLIAVPIGVAVSYFTVNALTNIITESMGIASAKVSVLLPGLITFAFLFAVIFLSVYFAATKAGKMRPVTAIKEERSKHIQQTIVSFRKLCALPVSVLLATRQITMKKRQSFLLLLLTVALTFVMVFSFDIMNSFSHIYDKAAQWGYDSRQEIVTFKESADQAFRENFYNILLSDNRVKVVMPVSDAGIYTTIRSEECNLKQNVAITVYDGDMTKMGAVTLEGRNPIADNEIAITKNIQKNFHKTIGDSIQLNINGINSDFLITGIYQSIMRLGWGIRAQASAIKKICPDFQISSYGVIFNNTGDLGNFVDEYTRNSNNRISLQSFRELLSSYLYGSSQGINGLTIFLSGIFAFVMLTIIYSTTQINLIRDKKTMGSLKAVGFTNGQLRMSFVYRAFILTGLGLLIGIPIGITCSGPFLSVALTGIGVAQFPMVSSPLGVVLSVPLCLALNFIGVWLPTHKLLDINTRSLILD